MKNTLLALLGFILLSTPLAATAAQYGDFTYTSSGSAVTITGYTGPGGAVTIPARILVYFPPFTFRFLPVTTIGRQAFFRQTSLTNVTIPGTVTSIGQQAFAYCTSLTSVTISNGVTSIGYEAFFSCTSLTSVTIPGNVTSIVYEAFSGCTSLIAITVDAANASYSSLDGVLFNKSQTTLIQYPGGRAGNYLIPGSVTNIEGYAFAYCTSLTSVTISKGVTSIGGGAFYSCTSLIAFIVDPANAANSSLDGVLFNKSKTTLILFPPGKGGSYAIPGTVTSIGNSALRFCTKLTGVTLPDSVTSIGGSAFSDSGLTNVTIPGTVTSIGNGAFQFCTSLTTVTILNGVASIGDWAFSGCPGLTSVTILNGVTIIGDWAFYACPSLTKVTIPGSVISIGNYAFYYCPSLIAITVDAANAYYSSLDGVVFNKSQTRLILFPPGKGGSYAIPGSVTYIERNAFLGCTSLTNVTIPNSLTGAGDYAFASCTSLQGVFFKGNAPSVGSGVFDNASNTVYYLTGTTGWGATFGGRPTRLWNPLMQSSGPGFGVGPAGFGFNITGTTNIPIVVEACTNLGNTSWVALQSLNLTNGTFYFSDPDWTNYPARLYRIRSP